MNFPFRLLSAAIFTYGLGGLAQTSSVRTEIPRAAQPQLAAAADGRVWVVYGQLLEAPTAPPEAQKHKGHTPPVRSGDVFVALSADGGATFAAPVKVAHVPKLMLGLRRGPRIAVNGPNLTVTVNAHELLAFNSSDGGSTWSGPVVVNHVPTSAREGLHDLAAAPDGRLFVTWLDLRNGKMELWGAWSNDGGRTWGANERVYRSPDKSICECCHPSALFDAAGNLAVMWRNSIEGARDMWISVRARGAAEFGPATKLGEGSWKLNACPMDGGRIVALGGGAFGAVWTRNGEVYFSRREGAETKLGQGKQPVAVLARDGRPLVVWQQGAGLVSSEGNPGSTPTARAADARFPSVLTVPGDRGVLLAYERGEKAATSIVVERL